IGLSTGLDYIPCNYSDTNELIELCRPAGEAGGVYVTHQRSYGAKVIDATHETLAIGREARMPVHISHYNGFADVLLPLIDDGRIMRHPGHMAGSDGIYTGGKPHPRGYGTFARYLGEYVRAQKVLGLEEAIRHMTSAPAARFKLNDRGLLRPGFAADVVIFD